MCCALVGCRCRADPPEIGRGKWRRGAACVCGGCWGCGSRVVSWRPAGARARRDALITDARRVRACVRIGYFTCDAPTNAATAPPNSRPHVITSRGAPPWPSLHRPHSRPARRRQSRDQSGPAPAAQPRARATTPYTGTPFSKLTQRILHMLLITDHVGTRTATHTRAWPEARGSYTHRLEPRSRRGPQHTPPMVP